MTLPKVFSIGGILTLVGSFFMHPESCVKPTDLVDKVIGNGPSDISTHIAALVGLLVLSMSRSITAAPNNYDPVTGVPLKK